MGLKHIQQVLCKGNKKTPYDSAKHEEEQIFISLFYFTFKWSILDMEIVKIYT